MWIICYINLALSNIIFSNVCITFPNILFQAFKSDVFYASSIVSNSTLIIASVAAIGDSRMNFYLSWCECELRISGIPGIYAWRELRESLGECAHVNTTVCLLICGRETFHAANFCNCVPTRADGSEDRKFSTRIFV